MDYLKEENVMFLDGLHIGKETKVKEHLKVQTGLWKTRVLMERHGRNLCE